MAYGSSPTPASRKREMNPQPRERETAACQMLRSLWREVDRIHAHRLSSLRLADTHNHGRLEFMPCFPVANLRAASLHSAFMRWLNW
jgi:hypothetical protein